MPTLLQTCTDALNYGFIKAFHCTSEREANLLLHTVHMDNEFVPDKDHFECAIKHFRGQPQKRTIGYHLEGSSMFPIGDEMFFQSIQMTKIRGQVFTTCPNTEKLFLSLSESVRDFVHSVGIDEYRIGYTFKSHLYKAFIYFNSEKDRELFSALYPLVAT